MLHTQESPATADLICNWCQEFNLRSDTQDLSQTSLPILLLCGCNSKPLNTQMCSAFLWATKLRSGFCWAESWAAHPLVTTRPISLLDWVNRCKPHLFCCNAKHLANGYCLMVNAGSSKLKALKPGWEGSSYYTLMWNALRSREALHGIGRRVPVKANFHKTNSCQAGSCHELWQITTQTLAKLGILLSQNWINRQ